MKTIYKYPVPLTDDFTLDLPKGAKVLTVQMQHGEPQLWVLVDPENYTVKRSFRLVGTGHSVPTVGIWYINTFQLDNGSVVFHLFEYQNAD